MSGRASDLLATARKEIGYIEGPNNANKYAQIAGHANHQPWCATFVVAVSKLAGVKLPINTAYTPSFANAFKNAKRYGKMPKAGAIGFVYFPSKGRIAHCFIVEAVNTDGTYITIEGNTDVQGGRTGGRVMRHRRSTVNITFGYPEFVAEPKKVVTTKPTSHPAFSIQLRVGSAQNHSAWLWQTQMAKRGWDIKADGVYGEKSAIVAAAFAKEKKISVTHDSKNHVIVNKGLWDAAWTAPVTKK